MSLQNSEDDDKTIYKVVVNHEEQYSIWPEYKANPLGWNDVGKIQERAPHALGQAFYLAAPDAGAHDGRTAARLVLSGDQQKKFEQMKGKPFAMPEGALFRGPGGPGGGPGGRQQRRRRR